MARETDLMLRSRWNDKERPLKRIRKSRCSRLHNFYSQQQIFREHIQHYFQNCCILAYKIRLSPSPETGYGGTARCRCAFYYLAVVGEQSHNRPAVMYGLPKRGKARPPLAGSTTRLTLRLGKGFGQRTIERTNKEIEDSMTERTGISGLMAGKRGLIMGVANDRSIAWGIAQSAAAAGAELAFTYLGDALLKRVRPLADQVGGRLVLPCDVADDASIDAAFATLEQEWGQLDFVVHAIAFSDKNELDGLYLDTSRNNFARTLDISCYSFTAVCQRAAKLLRPGGSLLTLSYYGAEKVMPHYNVMGVAKAALEASVKYLANDLGPRGIRVNAISAGPIKTLAASGIGDFRYILKWNELNAPLRRNVTIHEVGNAALYLLSDLGSGVTGENMHVDAGYHTVGMVQVDAAHETGKLLAGMTVGGGGDKG
jgi:enoyl-[acyl-carrier protein] reductase I